MASKRCSSAVKRLAFPSKAGEHVSSGAAWSFAISTTQMQQPSYIHEPQMMMHTILHHQMHTIATTKTSRTTAVNRMAVSCIVYAGKAGCNRS